MVWYEIWVLLHVVSCYECNLSFVIVTESNRTAYLVLGIYMVKKKKELVEDIVEELDSFP